MARQESDREDLLAEAVSFVRRLEGRVDGSDVLVTCGLRDNGRLSLYFGADPVYQFDADGGLRRAYVSGLLYRTQGKTLARLRRSRSDAETTLYRYDLDPAELAAFQTALRECVGAFAGALAAGRVQILRRIPADDVAFDAELLVRLRQALAADPWLAPAIPGKP